MKTLAIGFLLSGGLCSAFGYWGLYTFGGRRAFDEMAGMIPLFMGIFGLLLIGLAVGLFAYRWLFKPDEALSVSNNKIEDE